MAAAKRTPADHRPLYQRIRGAIEAKIMAGTLQPGDRIPFEHELMAEYSCSRMTVNKALSSLAAAGLIIRQRRVGSFVSQPRIHMAALQIPDMREEIEKRGFVYSMQLLSRSVLEADSPAADKMPVPGNGRLLALDCLHLADGKPFSTEHRLINLLAVPSVMDADFSETSPGSWLLKHVPWTEAEHRIHADAADDDAVLLKIKRTTACLVLERRTWRHDESITYVRHVFTGDSFDLTARFVSLESGEPAPSN